VRRKLFIAAVLWALALTSCGGSSKSEAPTAATKPAAPAIPPAIQQVAESSLGSETEVLVFGDLAHNGAQELLAINRLKTTPQGMVPGILFTRAVVVEQDGGTWKEAFRCDEHLKNPKGYLGGTPLAPVNGWRLQYEQHPDTGLVMYITPLQPPTGGHIQTIGVRWNAKAKRYQSLDPSFQQFLGEVPALETPEMQLHR
jgi:hypothetical protein